MVGSRTLTAAIGLAGSLAVTVALWWYLDTLAVFLFLPVVPFLFRGWGDEPERAPAKTCPRCDFRSHNDEFDYCPRDGTRLERRSNRD